jgi:endonuclease YncB( thermonuclease family)
MRFLILFIASAVMPFTPAHQALTAARIANAPILLLTAWLLLPAYNVSDGDTWKFELKDEQFSVRVLYVDCFETRRGSRLEKQATAGGISPDSALALGKLAKHLADSLMTDKPVTMLRDYEADNLDVYGRLLRITIIDGMRLDSLMLEEGYGVGI